jgi:hypothetical protein
MEYGDFIVWVTGIALGASILVIVGLMGWLIKKSMEPPPQS